MPLVADRSHVFLSPAGFLFLLGAILMLLLAGCQHRAQKPAEVATVDPARQGQVSARVVEPELEARYPSQPGMRYEQPTAFPDNPMPAYPETLLAARLPPVQLTLRLIINEEGRVSDVRPVTRIANEHEPFLSAARVAVLKWKFLPLIQIGAGPGKTMITVGEYTTAYPGAAIALPFHQDYVFTFRQLDGVPSVTAQ